VGVGADDGGIAGIITDCLQMLSSMAMFVYLLVIIIIIMLPIKP
jgi:hypothetical protein